MAHLDLDLSGCPVDCRGCSATEGDASEASGVLRGPVLALYSLVTFILPLGLAVGGAWWLGEGPASQLLAGLGGLGLGMLVVRVVASRRARRLGGLP